MADERLGHQRMQAAGESVVDRFREAVFTGIAVMVPLLITFYVLLTAVDLLMGVLDPLARFLQQAGIAPDRQKFIIQVAAIVSLTVLTLGIGFAASLPTGDKVIAYFDEVVERIPGIGAIYTSFRQMSDVMLESDANNFREVKLVEYPHEGTYTLGFETTRTPDPIRTAAGDQTMRTLFLPLAPNPVMGGFLAHIPEERIMDVDMTVEEGMRTVITTGVAVAEPGQGEGLSREKLEQLGGVDVADALDDERGDQ